MKSWRIAAVLFCLLICVSCAPNTAKQQDQAADTETGISEETISQNEGGAEGASQQVSNQTSKADEDTEDAVETVLLQEDVEMSIEEIFDLLSKIFGSGCEAFAAEVETAVDSKQRLFIRLAVTPGLEEAADNWLSSFGGSGHDASNRKLPAFDNKVCEQLRQMTPVKAYSIFRQGEDGVKTASTEIMTAKDADGNLHIFILGI